MRLVAMNMADPGGRSSRYESCDGLVRLQLSANPTGGIMPRAQQWGAVGVVLDPPVSVEDLGLEQGVELLDGQQLVVTRLP
jgi:hypothetical protein